MVGVGPLVITISLQSVSQQPRRRGWEGVIIIIVTCLSVYQLSHSLSNTLIEYFINCCYYNICQLLDEKKINWSFFFPWLSVEHVDVVCRIELTVMMGLQIHVGWCWYVGHIIRTDSTRNGPATALSLALINWFLCYTDNTGTSCVFSMAPAAQFVPTTGSIVANLCGSVSMAIMLLTL